jgi:hypothetical protein
MNTPEQEQSPDQIQAPETKRDVNESVRELEALDLGKAGDLSTKIELTLMLAGEKPANEIHQAHTTYREGQDDPDVRDHSGFDQLVDWAKASGLSTEVLDEHIDGRGRRFERASGKPRGEIYAAKYLQPNEPLKTAEDRLTLLVARDEVWLEKMKHAYNTRDDELQGECYGFPASARQAFSEGHNVISPNSIDAPAEVKAFTKFMLSPDHWQEELKTAERWSERVKELSPKLYQAAVEKEQTHEANPGYIYGLIEDRKALRGEADQLRLEALNMALQWDVLDQFPELEKWQPDAKRQGLLKKPSDQGQSREEAIEKIRAMESEADKKERYADSLSAEIRKISNK